VLASLGACDRIGEVLDRVDGLPVLADEERHVRAAAAYGDSALVIARRDRHVRADSRCDALDHLAHLA
jgi:hypothetical protein